MEQSIPHWLTKQAELSPDKTMLELTDGTKITFHQFMQSSQAFARKLANLGVGKNQRVAILSTNQVHMAVAIFALSYIEAIAVMVNIRLTKAEIAYQLNTSNTSLLLTTEELQQEKQLVYPNQKTFAEVTIVPEKQLTLTKKINLSRPFTMMFTSGTTGKPKAVVHTYGNHWWSAIGSALNIGTDKQDKWLLTLPIFHIGGFSILMKSVIYGMEVFLMEKYDVRVFYHAMLEKRVTIASIVTIMLRDLLQFVQDHPLPEHVRCLLLGGGSVPARLLAQVKEKGLPLFQSYGMTETCSQIVTLSGENIFSKIGSSGKALFPAEINILNKNNAGIGEILVKGPMVMQAYDANPEANEKSFLGAWFKTGDLGYIDSDGFLFVVDRRTDLIISGGENIYPTEVENVLLEMADILEVAVVAEEDEAWGQVPVAWVVGKDEQIAAGKILAHAKEKLANYKVPKEIYFTDQLPRNASNKIMRHQLKSLPTEKSH